ncbi:leucine-rich_repeat domain-containing protein [Hexamita inflata]|uniref:Leucine-rich_repeat domain-containing protein n=1 Tax=Hexamita inflata TaxID=28002 RepID=A0ABP1I736_9EUKA
MQFNYSANQLDTEYNKEMIEIYQDQIEDGALIIESDPELIGLDFIRTLKIQKLSINNCNNVIPILESENIIELSVSQCSFYSFEQFQLKYLKILKVQNSQVQKSQNQDTLIRVQQFTKFKELKKLLLFGFAVNINPLSQMTNLTQLILSFCGIRNTEALKPLINLEVLYLPGNESIDITSLQFLNKLIKISLNYCCLISLDALRPLSKLSELSIQHNSIIHLQPLVGLMQLQFLYATNNKILDIKSIKQHPNFQKFKLGVQEQPAKIELKMANMMININRPITSLRTILKKILQLKSYSIICRQQINSCLKQLRTNQVTLAQAILLFQQQNIQDDYQ